MLGISKRQVIRIKNRVRRVDFKGVVHGNRGRKPKSTIPKETKEIILSLYQNRYNGFNVSHFGEFLKEAHGINISRETLRNLLLTSGLRCKAKSAPKHRSRRQRMPREGLLIQMDSSQSISGCLKQVPGLLPQYMMLQGRSPMPYLWIVIPQRII